MLKFAGARWGAVVLLTSYLTLKDLSGVEKSEFADILGKLHGHVHDCLAQVRSTVQRHTNKLFVRGLFMEDTLQDALRAQPSSRTTFALLHTK